MPMTANEEARELTLATCKRTFSVCMKAAVYCLNERHEDPKDRRVEALLQCAEACLSCLNFTAQGSKAHATALTECANLCAQCADHWDTEDDPVLTECATSCRECAALCHDAANERIYMAG